MDDPPSFPMVIFLLVAFVAAIFIIGAIYSYFQKTTVTMSTAGSQSAMVQRLLSAPELSYQNTKNATEKFILDKRKLDTYKNKQIPGSRFDGTYYFIEIRDKANNRNWRFTNAPDFDNYAYNTRLRGFRPADEPAIEFCIPQGRKVMLSEYANKDPFSSTDETNMQVPITIVEGSNVLSAVTYWLIDPDSSYDSGNYRVKYPLCICDLDCPTPNGCKCSKDCSGAGDLKEVGMGQDCNS